ncbi:hypothetical protein DPMN_056122 [Dreissena polymorpha]|uniref:Uncharacterized protein n=1 Tax=Dreissena polymorpha TaxID=45954 RepID=A0A9D4CSL5_DREPO|nr:hypothetical protein DPMN_056122 [Dreissena polymorpha]
MNQDEESLREAMAEHPSKTAVSAHAKIREGIDIMSHRQELIKRADSTDSGWCVVQEYEAQPLADDSEDEKKINRAQVKTEIFKE